MFTHTLTPLYRPLVPDAQNAAVRDFFAARPEGDFWDVKQAFLDRRLWQDTARTLVADVGDPVAAIEGEMGRHIGTITSAPLPVLHTDGARYWLFSEGSAGIGLSDTGFTFGTKSRFILSAVRSTLNGDQDQNFRLMTDLDNIGGNLLGARILVQYSTGADRFVFDLAAGGAGTSGAAIGANNSAAQGLDHVVAASYTDATDDLRLFLSSNTSAATGVANMELSNSPVRFTTSGEPLWGRWYGALASQDPTNATTRLPLMGWAADRAGVTLS